jgi:hypothetical protein
MRRVEKMDHVWNHRIRVADNNPLRIIFELTGCADGEADYTFRLSLVPHEAPGLVAALQAATKEAERRMRLNDNDDDR